MKLVVEISLDGEAFKANADEQLEKCLGSLLNMFKTYNLNVRKDCPVSLFDSNGERCGSVVLKE